MALSEFEIARINRLFATYCVARIPERLRGKIRLDYRIDGDEVVLYESRSHYEQPEVWYSLAIARFLRDHHSFLWRLYSIDHDDNWIAYGVRPCARDLEKLLNEVSDDPMGIFWG